MWELGKPVYFTISEFPLGPPFYFVLSDLVYFFLVIRRSHLIGEIYNLHSFLTWKANFEKWDADNRGHDLRSIQLGKEKNSRSLGISTQTSQVHSQLRHKEEISKWPQSGYSPYQKSFASSFETGVRLWMFTFSLLRQLARVPVVPCPCFAFTSFPATVNRIWSEYDALDIKYILNLAKSSRI